MARTDPRPNYGTKRRVRVNGYIDIYEPEHPLARRDGYVMEHRKVAYDAGILTDDTMQVHHRNGNKADNRLRNLAVVSPSDHSRDHAEDTGVVRNQFGVWPVKPRERRQSAPRPMGRTCEACGELIDPALRRDARYCSERCQVNHWKRTARLA
jgi:hypothetical protein